MALLFIEKHRLFLRTRFKTDFVVKYFQGFCWRIGFLDNLHNKADVDVESSQRAKSMWLIYQSGGFNSAMAVAVINIDFARHIDNGRS